MQEIRCPKCGEVFQVDESGYAAIVKQVRDREFEKELRQRETIYDSEKESAVRIAVMKAESEKEKTIDDLRRKLAVAEANSAAKIAEIRSANEKKLAERDNRILSLTGQIELDKANSD
ncbi:MAG: DUF2130 domain-containing protein, partial [Oscillospiraceae bacterium]|nr:DUF2130 domain-containing protein [Oscillospiraceae bacterium]